MCSSAFDVGLGPGVDLVYDHSEAQTLVDFSGFVKGGVGYKK